MIDYKQIPQDTLESINLYVAEGIPPGDFLLGVLSNDLREAFGRADSRNTEAMEHIVAYCYNKIPSACWGSRDKVNAWLSFKLQQRTMQQQANKVCKSAMIL